MASATSSTRSSAAGRAPRRPGAAGRSPARTSATTSGSPSRRPSTGTEKEIEFPVLSRCETCGGNGAKPGTEPITCPQCNGRGEVRSRPPDDARPDGQRHACPRCQGEGKIVETPCETCQGEGRTERKRTLRVTIPAGIDEGHQIRLSNEGEVGPRGGPPGSLYVAVHVAAAPVARARGHGAVSTRPTVSIAQAALGTRITVPTVDGEEEVEIKAGHAARTPRSGCAARACRTSAGRASAATSTCSSTSSSRPSSRRRPARAARGVRRGGRRVGRRTAAALLEKLGLVVDRGRRVATSAAASGAWLELSVEADVEAVEAVSEILGRVRPAGRRVEPAFELVDEGLGARLDPTRPAIVRAYVPARDRGGRRARRRRGRPRRSATSRRSACGRSASCGRGSSTRPTGPRPGRRTSRSCASAGGSSSGRPGGATAARPTTSSSPSTRGWRSGPGSTRRPGSAWPAVEALADRGRARRRARPRRRLRLGDPRDRGACKLGAASALGVDTDPIAIEATIANARRNAARPPAPGARGQPAERRAAVRRRPRQPHRRACSSRSPRALARRAAARAGSCSPRASSSTARRRSAAAFEAAGLDVTGRTARGRLGRARGRPAGLNGARPYNRRRCPPYFPDPARRAHHPGDQPGPAVDPAAVRAADAARDGRVGEPASSGRCCGRRRTARSSIGLGLALTGLGLVAVARLGAAPAAVAARGADDLLRQPRRSRSSSSARTCAA